MWGVPRRWGTSTFSWPGTGRATTIRSENQDLYAERTVVLPERKSGSAPLPFIYSTGSPAQPKTSRSAQMGPSTLIPRSQWRFTSPTSIALDGGFQPLHWYELIYRSAFAPVTGAGLLALRDLGAHLRADHDLVFAHGYGRASSAAQARPRRDRSG